MDYQEKQPIKVNLIKCCSVSVHASEERQRKTDREREMLLYENKNTVFIKWDSGDRLNDIDFKA